MMRAWGKVWRLRWALSHILLGCSVVYAHPVSWVILGGESSERCVNPRGGSGLTLCTDGTGIFPHGELFGVLESLASPPVREDRSVRTLRRQVQSAWKGPVQEQLEGVRLICLNSDSNHYDRLRRMSARLVSTHHNRPTDRRSFWLEIPCTLDADTGNAAFLEALRVLNEQKCPVDSPWVRAFFSHRLTHHDLREVACGGIALSTQRWSSDSVLTNASETQVSPLWSQWDEYLSKPAFREHFAREMPAFVEERMVCPEGEESSRCFQRRGELWTYLENRGCHLDDGWRPVCEDSFLSREQWEMFYGFALKKLGDVLYEVSAIEFNEKDPKAFLRTVPGASWDRALTIANEARLWLGPKGCQSRQCRDPGFVREVSGFCREDFYCVAIKAFFVGEFLKLDSAGCYRIDPQSTPESFRIIRAPDVDCSQ